MAEEETEAQEQAPAEEKKSSPLMLIIIIIVLVLVILIGAIVTILMMSDDDGAQQSPQQKERRASGDSQMTSMLEVGPMYPLDNFTVNLLSESGRRYLKVEMNLELSGEELGPEIDTKTAVIRDVIIRLLSSKSLEEISTAKGKEKLKEQIVDQLNMRLRDGHVNNVYFTEFVIQ